MEYFTIYVRMVKLKKNKRNNNVFVLNAQCGATTSFAFSLPQSVDVLYIMDTPNNYNGIDGAIFLPYNQGELEDFTEIINSEKLQVVSQSNSNAGKK